MLSLSAQQAGACVTLHTRPMNPHTHLGIQPLEPFARLNPPYGTRAAFWPLTNKGWVVRQTARTLLSTRHEREILERPKNFLEERLEEQERCSRRSVVARVDANSA